jgi:hypothetical protein
MPQGVYELVMWRVIRTPNRIFIKLFINEMKNITSKDIMVCRSFRYGLPQLLN